MYGAEKALERGRAAVLQEFGRRAIAAGGYGAYLKGTYPVAVTCTLAAIMAYCAEAGIDFAACLRSAQEDVTANG